MDTIGLRAGLDDSELTLGLGLSIKNYNMDYAYGSQEMGASHRFSLGISFGPVLPLAGTKEWEEAKTVRSYCTKARKYCRKQEYFRASEELEKALGLDTENKAINRHIRKIQDKMSDTVEKGKFKEIEDFYYAQAYIAYKKGDVENAVTHWELLLGVNPTREEVREYLGKEKARLEKEAELERKRLSEEEKKMKIRDAYDMQVRCYDEGKWSESIVYGKKVLRLEPEHEGAKDYIDRAKDRIREEAEERVRKTVKKEPEPALEEKEEELEIKVDPEIVEGYYKQGITYYSQGKYQEAIIEWKKVLALDPTHEKAQKNIKKAQEKLGISE
jgi:tetratricopeptide (TPR) repeat protein